MAVHDAAERPAPVEHDAPADLTPEHDARPFADPDVAAERARILSRLDAHPDVADLERGEY